MKSQNFFGELTTIKSSKQLNDILEYLIRWLAYHILNTDKSLVRQIELIAKEDKSPSEAFEIEEEILEISTEPLLKALKVLYQLVTKKNKEIEKKNSELESRVKRRTEELELVNDQLKRLLLQDVLTGLPNRRFVMEEIQKQIYIWERYGTVFSILFIDIDKFKEVNDNYGHEKGDEVLKGLAKFLNKNIRKMDIASRLGGDEFVIICPNTDEKGAIKMGKKLNEKCETDEHCDLEFWNPSLSIGVAIMDNKIKTPSDLLNRADSAMYISKESGGGNTSIMID